MPDEIEPEEDEENAEFIPPIERAYRGYCVNYSVDGEEIESIFGKVVQIDPESNLLGIDFHVVNSKDAADYPSSKKPFPIWKNAENKTDMRTILPSTSDMKPKNEESASTIVKASNPDDYIWVKYDHGYLT